MTTIGNPQQDIRLVLSADITKHTVPRFPLPRVVEAGLGNAAGEFAVLDR